MRKGISPVVSMALLLIVAVSAAVGLQTWYNGYFSGVISDVEERDTTDHLLEINSIYADNLYLISDKAGHIAEFNIRDQVGNVMCSFTDSETINFDNTTRILFNFDQTYVNSTHVSDLSIYEDNATIGGAPSNSSSCVNGNCMSFNGSTDYLSVAGDTFIYDPMTVSIWVNSGDISAPGGNIFASSLRWNGIGHDGYLCYLRNSQIHCEVWFDTAGSGPNASSTLAITEDKWYHVVYRWGDGDVTLFVDGEEVSGADTMDIQFASNTSDMDLGRYNYQDNGYFQGQIDEFALYSRALSNNEIKSLYENKRALSSEQIIPEGIKILNISSCGLIRGEKYDITIFTDKITSSSSLVAR